MRVLVEGEIFEAIKEEAKKTREDIIVISAFCKIAALEELESCLQYCDKTLLVRMTYDDIVSGASDLEVYEFCKKHHWKMFFKLDLHAKTYIFDKKTCILGSSNLTAKGMNISQNGNYESATLFTLGDFDFQKLISVINDSVCMTDQIYRVMKASIQPENIRHSKNDWPDEIHDMFKKDVHAIFSTELPQVSSPFDAPKEAHLFMGTKELQDDKKMKQSFCESKAYRWILTQLKDKDTHEIYFGELTARLHNDIIEEPKPYRKDVKELLANLLNWIQELKMEEIEIDVPNHSTRVKLRKN